MVKRRTYNLTIFKFFRISFEVFPLGLIMLDTGSIWITRTSGGVGMQTREDTVCGEIGGGG